MAPRGKQKPQEDDPGAPEWMVTFSDCMTLLLTFFVLLLSFSSFDNKVFQRMESAFAEGLSSIGLSVTRSKEAFLPTPRVMYNQEPEKGSEKPTVDGQYESNPSESLDFLNFQDQKVFLVPSEDVFLGRGARISGHGRQMLTDVAALLMAIPNRVIVSEHALEAGQDDTDEIALNRAWTIAQFLTDGQGIAKTRMSITAAATVDAETLRHSGLTALNPGVSRVVEIVILERSTYN
ncbi:MAG TPA: flagellar motor protein MotB [Sedimentisphaerales bacterium]|nr:flagellar motor protein MotB [Sedimentisphaerales bacterium]HRS10892.1 flagellar motor protein MotB [Sedimentisphaerales bacterium]HRV47597.1 flagellar motor protein MotB [Sedimentisphaerales bacterium]